MKKRPLKNIIFLSVLTLGLYDIYWLASTRNEMVRKYRVKIPSANYMTLVKALQIIGAIIVIALVLFVTPAEHKKFTQAPFVPKPSANCFADYNVNPVCKSEIDKYYGQPTDTSADYYMSALLILIAMITLEAFYITRWLWPYAKAVGRITGGWSKGGAIAWTVPGILLPTAIKDMYPILIIQNAFNRM